MKVLIVDDEEGICKYLQRELQKDGYEVDYTTLSVGVLEKLQDAEMKGRDYAFDLLFLDLRMPVIDGFTLLKKIREAQFDLDVIIITGHSDENTAIKSIRLGAFDYLRKPISLEELHTATFRVRQKRAEKEKRGLEYCILVVDDEKDLCEYIKRELEKKGYQVAVAYDGIEGLDYFKNNHVDVVLANIKMSKMDGLEMLDKCRTITDDFVSIIITGHGDLEKAIEALKFGIFEYLKKPISLDELISSVSKGIDLLELRRGLSARKRELELEKALKELEQHSQQLKTMSMILGLAADGISIVDTEFNIIQVNETFAKMSGVSKEDAVGKKCYDVFSSEFCHTERCSLTQIHKGRTYFDYECEMKRADGQKIPCFVVAKPYKSIDGELIGIMEDFRDITKRKQAEEQIKSSLREKEVLLKEIHHRVKNNLQIISSLLNLQAEHVEDEHILEAFRISQTRIDSMALIHEELYRSDDLARIDFVEYLQKLVTNLYSSYGVDFETIKLNINAENILLDIDKAISCGLITNELVSNSLQHAFPDGKEGEIRVALRSDNNTLLTLTISDNGVGFPEDLDFRNTESLGMQLVVTLTKQLGATIEIDRNGGTTFNITFAK